MLSSLNSDMNTYPSNLTTAPLLVFIYLFSARGEGEGGRKREEGGRKREGGKERGEEMGGGGKGERGRTRSQSKVIIWRAVIYMCVWLFF